MKPGPVQVEIVAASKPPTGMDILVHLFIRAPLESLLLWKCWNYAASDWAWAPQLSFWKALCLMVVASCFMRNTFRVKSSYR